jgi:homoserine dehydrogenase
VNKIHNLCLAGFGNVGRSLVRLLAAKRNELAENYGIEWRITGIASRTLGWQVAPDGFDVQRLLASSPAGERVGDLREWLRAAHADVLFEATSLNVENGQPAVEHIRAALESGAHAISANKGPVVHAYRELTELAHRCGRRFLFESSVMDGIPIFSMFRDNLPAIELRGFRGVLNSTTNVILGELESGSSFDEAVRRAQQIGVAETDPSYDVDGWDAAVKVSALVTVLMKHPLPPTDVRRTGIRDLDAETVRRARAQGSPYKLVCRARRNGGSIEARVAPERVPLSDPLALVCGTSSIICFETDIFPGLVITEDNPGLDATAYGMLTDFITAVRNG